MSAPGPCRLDPSTPAGYAELLMRSRIDRAVARSNDDRRDVGASVVEWVIITALLVGLAIGVGAVIVKAVNDKAKSINLGAGT
jgi:hypothetical protein